LKDAQLADIEGKKGYPLGKEILRNAIDEQVKRHTYWWPHPGSDKPLEKVTFHARVEGQNCGVGNYKG
jgi:hypothetical protein